MDSGGFYQFRSDADPQATIDPETLEFLLAAIASGIFILGAVGLCFLLTKVEDATWRVLLYAFIAAMLLNVGYLNWGLY